MPSSRRLLLALLVGVSGAVVSSACNRAASEPTAPAAIRLVERYTPASLSGGASGTTPAALPKVEWRFDKDVPEVYDVAGATVRGGHLAGRSTSDFPMFRLERSASTQDQDQVHAFEIRMRVSAGSNLSLSTQPPGKVDLNEVSRRARSSPWVITTPLLPGSDIQTYTVPSPPTLNMARARQLLIRPTDAAGASFEIESVRVVTRREHLAGLPSGVGWQGLSDIYRETIVARAPETMRFDVDVPARGWLDLAVGTVDERPITFTVALVESGGAQTLLEHTVSTNYRWDHRPVDLSSVAGRRATLALSLRGEPGTIGFWGSPVVRARKGPGETPQGVIWVHADTLRADHLDVYGYHRPTGPTIRTLAAEGVLFRQAMAQAGWTKVSSPSFLTGLYPTTTGVFTSQDRLPASATTIAEVYQAAGYATVAFTSNGFVGAGTNLHQGYDEFHEAGSLTDNAPPYNSKTARECIERAAQWIERHPDTPFFMYIQLNDPHAPYEPRAPYAGMWADPAGRDEHLREMKQFKPKIVDDGLAARGLARREEMLAAGVDPAKYIAYDLAWYDGAIRGLDTEMGRLLERLRTIGLDRDVAIVFMSDHGEEFHDHGGVWHERSVYGELAHVPLIIRWPRGIAAGRVVEDPVHLLDIMPTLLDLGRLPQPKGMQGQTLAPLVRLGEPGVWKRQPVIIEKQPLSRNASVDTPGRARMATESYAIIDGPWKLVRNQVREQKTPEFELYEFSKDPLDQKDVAAEHPDVVARLAKVLDGWHTKATDARLKPDAETTKSLSADELQRLRSLGYLK